MVMNKIYSTFPTLILSRTIDRYPFDFILTEHAVQLSWKWTLYIPGEG